MSLAWVVVSPIEMPQNILVALSYDNALWHRNQRPQLGLSCLQAVLHTTAQKHFLFLPVPQIFL